MNRYKVIYERQVDTAYSFWHYAEEIIEARGLMHAQKLAHAHMRELKKLERLPMRIAKIKQVSSDA